MNQVRRVRSPRQHPRTGKAVRRFKRPLVVLTYRDNQLTTIHSSTPQIQFVQLNLTNLPNPDNESTSFPPPSSANALSVPSLSDMPVELHQAAQRAFRRS